MWMNEHRDRNCDQNSKGDVDVGSWLFMIRAGAREQWRNWISYSAFSFSFPRMLNAPFSNNLILIIWFWLCVTIHLYTFSVHMNCPSPNSQMSKPLQCWNSDPEVSTSALNTWFSKRLKYSLCKHFNFIFLTLLKILAIMVDSSCGKIQKFTVKWAISSCTKQLLT